MIAAIDVYYKEELAKSVAITFEWNDAVPAQIFKHTGRVPGAYIPGQFYMRELPCVLDVLQQIDLSVIDAIVVDGYVYVDDALAPGLGAHLWEALNKKVPVIGVAKTSFQQNKKTVIAVQRGMSKNPLFISAVGIDVTLAANHIEKMSGEYRMPDLLKKLDCLTKDGI